MEKMHLKALQLYICVYTHILIYPVKAYVMTHLYMYTFQYASRCKTTGKILSSPCQLFVSLTYVSNKTELCKGLYASSVGVSVASAIKFF